MTAPLPGRRVVVVGGTSGMGRATVRLAAEAGADVVAAGRRADSRLPSDGAGAGTVSGAVVDVTDEASIRALFDRVGELDHLLVTASPAPGPRSAFLDQDVAAAREFVDGKLFGSWACARYAVPRMRPCGSVTFVTGGTAVRPAVGLSMVTTAFAALEALTRALAVEIGPLRINLVHDPHAPRFLSLAEAPEPAPGASQVLS